MAKSKKVVFPSSLRVYVGSKRATTAVRNDCFKCIFADALNQKYGKQFGDKIAVAYGEVCLGINPMIVGPGKVIYKGNTRQVEAEKRWEKTGKIKPGHYTFKRAK